MSKLEYLSVIFSNALVLTFLVSGFSKIADYKENKRIVEKINIFPKVAASTLGLGLPYLEIGVAILLLFNMWTPITMFLLLALICGFILVNSLVIIRKEDIACNCFGRFMKGKLGLGGLYHSLILLLFSLPLFFLGSYNNLEFIMHAAAGESLLLILSSLGLFFTGLFSRLTDIS